VIRQRRGVGMPNVRSFTSAAKLTELKQAHPPRWPSSRPGGCGTRHTVSWRSPQWLNESPTVARFDARAGCWGEHDPRMQVHTGDVALDVSMRYDSVVEHRFALWGVAPPLETSGVRSGGRLEWLARAFNRPANTTRPDLAGPCLCRMPGQRCRYSRWHAVVVWRADARFYLWWWGDVLNRIGPVGRPKSRRHAILGSASAFATR